MTPGQLEKLIQEYLLTLSDEQKTAEYDTFRGLAEMQLRDFVEWYKVRGR